MQEAEHAAFSHTWDPLATGTGPSLLTAMGGCGRAGAQRPPSEEAGRLWGQGDKVGGWRSTDRFALLLCGGPSRMEATFAAMEGAVYLLGNRLQSWAWTHSFPVCFILSMRTRLKGFLSEKLCLLSNNPEVSGQLHQVCNFY